jgi:hypothetical protein
VKTSELEGVQLDYWTARADGREAKIMQPGERLGRMRAAMTEPTCVVLAPDYTGHWKPFRVDWDSAGPIIERERIAVMPLRSDVWGASVFGDAYVFSIDEGESDVDATGPTPLVAAMRAYVASKFGEEVPAP